MDASRQDFDTIGLMADDWKAFILGRGIIHPSKLAAARSAVAKLGRYSPAQAGDITLTDFALRTLATLHPHFWLQGETLTGEEKIRFHQAKTNATREEAESHLNHVDADLKREAEIFGKHQP